ncbi:MAG: hypothetical protein HY362_03800 [Candidatus Aenigmarchaeota archaeon]|nr:hypothetical protein [Candidatus Aenigmarchaeota archaeon]
MAEKRVFIPIDLAKKLAGEGKNEGDIIEELKKRGFTPFQIDNALKAALKDAVVPKRPYVSTLPPPQESIPMAESETPVNVAGVEKPSEGYPPEKILIPEKLQPLAPPGERPPAMDETKPSAGEVTVEELVESVVEERWQGMAEKIGAFLNKEESIASELKSLREKIEDVSSAEKATDSTLSQQIDQFSSDHGKLETRLKALEKAFKEFAEWSRKK